MTFDDHEFTIDVTIDGVRTSLSEIDASSLPDATIQQAIEEETLTVKAKLPDTTDELNTQLEGEDLEAAVEMLVRRRAGRAAFNTSPMEVRQQALDAARSFDVQSFRGWINTRIEEAEEAVGIPQGGTSAAFTDATTSIMDPDHPDSNWNAR